nr:sigma-70 family RNA polymerase sigma factor [uncultured Arsenicibacter sp.]
MDYKKGPSSHHDDAYLWQQLIAGNYQALGLIYQQHCSALIQYGRKLTANDDLVKDNVQDLFVELWNRHEQLNKDVEQVKLYLLGALRHKIARSAKLQDLTITLETADESSYAEQSYESVLITAEQETERSNRVREAISDLAPRQQEIIHLRFYQNLNHRQTAEVMNMREQSVRNLLHVTLMQLRKKLDFAIQIPLICLLSLYC